MQLLRLAAQALDDKVWAREQITSQGALITSSRGRQCPHPLIAVERRAALLFAALTKQLGLDREEQ